MSGRTRTTKQELEIIKIKILAEYEKTQILTEIARNLNISPTKMKHYAKQLGLKGAGNTPLLTPELENEIRKEYLTNPNHQTICKKLGLNYNTMRNHFKRMGLENIRSTKIIWVDETHVQCSKCSKIILYSELETLHINSTNPAKISYCRECRTVQARKNINSTLRNYLANRLRKLRSRAVKKELPFDITVEDLLEQYTQQKGKCFYTGEILQVPVNNNDIMQSP